MTTNLNQRAFLPALALFLTAPLVAEFLLGNLSLKMLPALIVLAPMYGGGALLIREVVRRNGRGWPSILLLALAYGIFEEAFTTQSLFNPDYLGLKMGLLTPAWIPALGIGGAWTVYVLNLHTVWSISVPIALIEGLRGQRAEQPWLGRLGVTVTGLLFALGVVATTAFSYKHDRYLSSPAQFASSAVLIAILVATAFLLPRKIPRAPRVIAESSLPAWATGLAALAAGSAIMTIPLGWNSSAVVLRLAVDALTATLVWFWSRRPGWNLQHKVALASGAGLAYAWHAFSMHAMGAPVYLARIGNVLFAGGAIALMVAAWRCAAERDAGSTTQETAALPAEQPVQQ
jgi:hypothetical protein